MKGYGDQKIVEKDIELIVKALDSEQIMVVEL